MGQGRFQDDGSGGFQLVGGPLLPCNLQAMFPETGVWPQVETTTAPTDNITL